MPVPQHQRKKRRLGNSANSCIKRQAERIDHVWSWDFVHDQTSDGRPRKFLVIIDEYTRENLVLEPARKMNSEDVLDHLVKLFRTRGVPGYLRSDNGPEFIAKRVQAWLARAAVETLYIEPGAPWENAYCESFNSRLRDELLDGEIFDTLLQARALAQRWRERYNTWRPHSSLGYQSPAEFAAQCRKQETDRLVVNEPRELTPMAGGS